MAGREKIPQIVEAEILFINDKVCCICHKYDRGVQIHHIDGNPSNNNLDNLAVLCQEHHDEIHKKGGVTKSYSPHLIKKYKQCWEQHIEARNLHGHKGLKTETGIERILFEFEIRKTAYEIISLPENEIKEVNTRLEFLYSIHLLENGYTDNILNDIKHVTYLIAYSDSNKSKIIVDKLYEFFWHFFDSKAVKMSKEDLKRLSLALEILETLGTNGAEFGRSEKIIESVCTAYIDFWNIVLEYSLKELSCKIIKDINKIIEGCETSYLNERQTPFIKGLAAIKNLLEELRLITIKRNPQWKGAIGSIEKMIVTLQKKLG